MLEKKRLGDKDAVSAHPILCISSGLSTAELFSGCFLLAEQVASSVSAPASAHPVVRPHAATLPMSLADAIPG